MKFLILLASVVVQVCLGGLYAWSSFVPALKESYHLSTAQTQLIFGTMIAVFTMTMVVAGRVLERSGPRRLLCVSGLLFALGYCIASFSGGSFLLLFVGISVVAGIATGIGYMCPLSTCIKWFPAHRGLVVGLAVAGFGGGSILLATLTEPFLARGESVLTIFRWVGIIYGVTILIAGLMMKFPSHQSITEVSSTHIKTSLAKDSYFWALATAMFCGTFAGLLVIGNLKPLALSFGIATSHATYAISAFAVGNATGRVLWGWAVDQMGKKVIIPSLLFLAASIAILLPAASNVITIVFISAFIGFGFGACFVINASLVATRYGADRVGNVYPLIFLAYGAAGITGPSLGGWLYDLTGSYASSIDVSIIVVILGMFTNGWLMRRAESNDH